MCQCRPRPEKTDDEILREYREKRLIDAYKRGHLKGAKAMKKRIKKKLFDIAVENAGLEKI